MRHHSSIREQLCRLSDMVHFGGVFFVTFFFVIAVGVFQRTSYYLKTTDNLVTLM